MVVALHIAGDGVLRAVIELEQHCGKAGVLGGGVLTLGVHAAGEGRHQGVER